MPGLTFGDGCFVVDGKPDDSGKLLVSVLPSKYSQQRIDLKEWVAFCREQVNQYAPPVALVWPPPHISEQEKAALIASVEEAVSKGRIGNLIACPSGIVHSTAYEPEEIKKSVALYNEHRRERDPFAFYDGFRVVMRFGDGSEIAFGKAREECLTAFAAIEIAQGIRRPTELEKHHVLNCVKCKTAHDHLRNLYEQSQQALAAEMSICAICGVRAGAFHDPNCPIRVAAELSASIAVPGTCPHVWRYSGGTHEKTTRECFTKQIEESPGQWQPLNHEAHRQERQKTLAADTKFPCPACGKYECKKCKADKQTEADAMAAFFKKSTHDK